MTNEDYKELYDSATVGLWRTAISDGRFLNLNSAVAHILGYDDIDDLAACNASHLYERTYDRQALIEELEELREVEDFEVCMKKKDGSPVWVAISAKIYPEKGYIEGSIRDITKEKETTDRFIPHLEKLSGIKENIKNRLQQDQREYAGNKSLRIA